MSDGWRTFSVQFIRRPKVCALRLFGCHRKSQWPDVDGWYWRRAPTKVHRNAVEAICGACYLALRRVDDPSWINPRKEVPVSRQRVHAIPERCSKCGGALNIDAPFPRIVCINCGWDAYVAPEPEQSSGVRPALIAWVTAFVVLLIAGGSASGVGGRYVPIADNALSTTAEEICPAAGNRIGCVCTNNDATIHMRVGDSTVTTTQGVQLRAGTSGTFTSPFAIYFVAESGTPTVSCTDERQP